MSALAGWRDRARSAWTRRILAPLALLGVVVGLWQVYATSSSLPITVLASPVAVLARLVNQPSLFLLHAQTTLLEILAGFAVGLGVGLAAAVAIVAWRSFERTFLPLFVASQVVPTFALTPLLVLWLGFGAEPKIAVIALGVCFPVTVNTVKGMRSADPGAIELMRTFRASDARILRAVRIPAALPYLFAAMQLGVAYAVLGAVFVEWFGSQHGLGKLMLVGLVRRQTDLMLASVIVVALIALVLLALVRVARRWAMPWDREAPEAELAHIERGAVPVSTGGAG
jgi:ABC-type nitrate/sulfonate/bicarbonate transport system permease component